MDANWRSLACIRGFLLRRRSRRDYIREIRVIRGYSGPLPLILRLISIWLLISILGTTHPGLDVLLTPSAHATVCAGHDALFAGCESPRQV